METFENIVLTNFDAIRAQMEEKAIREEELKMVVGTAEQSGVKLRNADGTRCLAKLNIAEVFYYAEYEAEGNGFKIIDAYWHKTLVTGW